MPTKSEGGWATSWLQFAAVMLILAGSLQALNGLVALVNKEFYVRGPNYTYQFSVTTWGWIHLILGVILVLSGIGVYSGNILARTIGVFVAVGGAIANFMALPQTPFWSTILIAINVVVIYALTVYGRDLADE